MNTVKRTKKTVQVDYFMIRDGVISRDIDGHGIMAGRWDPGWTVHENTTGTLYNLPYNAQHTDAQILTFELEIGGQKITHTIKINHEGLAIVRIGDVHSRTRYCLNESHPEQYFYAGSSFTLRNLTTHLKCEMEDDCGLIELAFERYLGDQCLGTFHQEIYIT